MIPRGSNDKRLTNSDHCAYISQPPAIASDGVPVLVLWLIYECSDTVEQSRIPGGSNDKRLTNIDTHNCYSYAK